MDEGYTYILERLESKLQRRFYVGYTKDLRRRMKEHLKDRRKNYKLIWVVDGNFEKTIKKCGAVLFVECLREGRFVKEK